MGTIDIEKTLARINSNGLFGGIERQAYDISIDSAMRTIEAIGKQRNPRFVIDNENHFVYENLCRWCFGLPNMCCIDPANKAVIKGRYKSGIYIAGNTGSGKSWALEIMSALISTLGLQVRVYGKERSAAWCNSRSDMMCDEYVSQGTVERFKKMTILCIQDLGAEPTESVYMGNRINVLRQIIEYRGDRTDQLTLITSNLPMNHQAFIDRYGDRVASRLNEMCNYFELKGKDRRKIL